VWAINVVVVDVLGEESVQASLVGYDRVVQTLGAYGAHDAFADGVRTWRPDRCPDTGDLQVGQTCSECVAVDGVAIVDEIFGLTSRRCSFDRGGRAG
jgi:hypothetical protein